MSKSGFASFLIKLGYSPSPDVENRFVHSIEVNQNQKAEIEFIYTPDGANFNKEIYKEHCRIWNSNKAGNFVVVSDEKSYVFNPKVKPDEANPFQAEIEPFGSGIKTEIDPKTLEWLSIQQINAGYFFDFVREKTKQNREQEVDKDLLLNLIALRLDLASNKDSQTVADLLILRCLFLKYLEDRGIYSYSYLSSILQTGNPKQLIHAFENVGRINGDIFRNEPLSENDFSSKHMLCLYRFFNSDYRSGQGTLFPYQFQHIPIQLISHVYESFLSNSKKHGKGIYYTPQFIVRFMLEETLSPLLAENQNVSILDPACGSGAFLVESFKKIVAAQKVENDFESKKDILVNQIFGIDNDPQALRIATFSLYLALLEDLDAAFVRKQIEDHAPILPSLIGKNLLHGNTLINDDLFKGKAFGCIIGNPPWGSVPDDVDPEHKEERKAIGSKGKVGDKPEYQNVADYQRSQAFLIRVTKWAALDSNIGLIINNSVFLNEHAELFRQDFLNKNKIRCLYELSHLNKILFRKKIIGKVAGEPIETGATEPAAFLVFSKSLDSENQVRYVSPRLTSLSEHLKIVHFTQRDVKKIKQAEFKTNDLLWKIFVNGSWDDYLLIKQKKSEQDAQTVIECRSGFQPKKNMTSIGKPDLRPLVKSADFKPYFIRGNLKKFNWNQELRRKPEEEIFEGKKIIVPLRPTERDCLRLRAARLSKNEIFQHDVLGIKIKKNGRYLSDYACYLGILNSNSIGYIAYLTATQWGKGGLKRDTLRNSDLEKLPLPNLEGHENLVLQISNLAIKIEQVKRDSKNSIDSLQKKIKEIADDLSKDMVIQKDKLKIEQIRNETEKSVYELQTLIDELVFDLYDLLDFEKEIIREFYDIHVNRKDAQVTERDLIAYAQKFKSVFELMLSDHLMLCCEYKISKQFGAFICFFIKNRTTEVKPISRSNIEDEMVFHAIKNAQLVESFSSNRLNELPTKVYTPEKFFLIKSNFFKDWTVRQAIEDANEEVKTLVRETQTTA